MSLESKFWLRIFSPARMARIVAALDKSTGIIIGSAWLAAFVTLGMAAFAVTGAVSAQKDALAALASEPIVPSISTRPATARELQVVAERLQGQFPDVAIATRAGRGRNQELLIKSDNGAKFHDWISSLTYVDTMAPQFRWKIHEFCVGVCGRGLMMATLTGEKIVLAGQP